MIVAVWPTATLAMSAVSTASCTVYRPVLTTWICALVPEESEPELAAAATRLLDDPRFADDWPEPLPVPVTVVAPVPLLESCSPSVMFTAATVPSKVATSSAFASARFAVVSESFAEVTLDSSAAICADEALADSSSVSLACALGEIRLSGGDRRLQRRGVDRCEHLARFDGVTSLDVDGGHRARRREAQVVRLGRGDGPLGRDRHAHRVRW